MPHSTPLADLKLFYSAVRPSSGKLLLQARVGVRLDADHIAPAVAGDLTQMRRVGVKGVFHQNDRHPAIAFAQGFAEPLGRIALAIVLFRSVLPQDRLEVEGED